MPRRQVPSRGDVCCAAPRLRENFAGHQKPKLDSDASESDAFAAFLCGCGNIVEACQFSALHSAPIVDDGQARVGRVRKEANAGGIGVERVRNYLGQDRLFERTGVGVSQVFEEVLEVDSGFYRANESSATTPVRCICAAPRP